jgi:hypothetical protein
MSDQEWEERVDKLCSELQGKSHAGQLTKEMYLLYNERFQPKETCSVCSSVSSRIWKRLSTYWKNNILKKDNMIEDKANEILSKDSSLTYIELINEVQFQTGATLTDSGKKLIISLHQEFMKNKLIEKEITKKTKNGRKKI